MGGALSSRQSSQVERNRRLGEFEEQLVEQSASNVHPHRPHSATSTMSQTVPSYNYFHQFLGESGDKVDANRQSGGFSREVNQDNVVLIGGGGDNNDNKEVDDAIAELEETFRTLLPPSDKEEDNHFRSKSCGSLLNSNSSVEQDNGGAGGGSGRLRSRGERQGTPMKGGPHHRPQGTHRRPLGGEQQKLSRSSGGLLVAGNTGGNDITKVATSSAPPGGPQQQWTPPKIQGFDVDKFREANKKPGTGSVVNVGEFLPNPGESQVAENVFLLTSGNGIPPSQCSTATPPPLLRQPPSYTREELEILRKLERQVF